MGILGFEGRNCTWRGRTSGKQSKYPGRDSPGSKGAQDPGGAQGGKRRRAGGAGVSRRFTRSRAPSTPSGGTSGPRSWSAARRRRRGAATASGSALPARILPNKYLRGSRVDAVRIFRRINAWALGPRGPCNPRLLTGHSSSSLRPTPASPVHCVSEKMSPPSIQETIPSPLSPPLLLPTETAHRSRSSLGPRVHVPQSPEPGISAQQPYSLLETHRPRPRCLHIHSGMQALAPRPSRASYLSSSGSTSGVSSPASSVSGPAGPSS